MALAAVNWAWSLTGLTTAQKLVLVRLADRCRSGSWECWPAIESVGRDCSLSESSVRRALHSLARIGLISYVGTTVGGRSRPNHYRLAVTPKGVNDAPKRVSNGALKGVTDDAKGCQALTPESLKNRYEPRARPSGNRYAAARGGEDQPPAETYQQRMARLVAEREDHDQAVAQLVDDDERSRWW